jgi:HSP20 family protein
VKELTFKSYDDMLNDLERQMKRVSDDILTHMFRMSSASGEVWSPRVDVYETADAVVVKVCVAGLDPANLELALTADNRFLTLRGVRIDQDSDKVDRIRYHQLEVYYGPFERIVSMPPGIPLDHDALTATYKDGFMKVVLPKKKRPSSRTIEIE